MIGQYWAQPDYQRLTSPHVQIERRAETIGTHRKEHAFFSGKARELIGLLENGPRSVSEIKAALGATWDSIEMILARAGNHDPRLWEAKGRLIGKTNKPVTYTFVGLGEIGELPEGVEIIIEGEK